MLCRVMDPSVMDSWSLTLLGGFELRPADGAVADLPGQKDRALLAILAMASGDAHSRERLAGLLWSEHGDRQARDSLKQTLVRLRRCLGGVEGGALRADRQSIALDRTVVDVDVLAFERLVAAGTFDSLVQATTLYRGDLLEGIAIRDPAFEDWLLVERQRLGQLFERALAGLMAQAMAVGDRERAAEAARRLLQLDPLSEAAYRTLMQVHADEAQTAQALKLYEALRERLYRELGVAPESATVALHDRIRQRRTAVADTEPEPAAGSPATGREDPPPVAKSSIAVLPFLNLSDDPEQRYYSDGISEDITTGLSRFRSLLVIARNSAFQYRDRAVDVRTVAHDLGVLYVVEGSVRKAGDRIRVTVQLIDAATGNHLWAEQYDHDLSNLFAVQDEVTQAIVATLEGRVAAGAAARARRKPTQHMDAYDYVLQARDLMARYDLAAAEPLLVRAIAADPTYAEAYARRAYAVLSRYWADQDGTALNEAARLAQKALALDADDEWSNFAMGTVRLSMRQFDLAGSHYERILGVNPNNVSCATIFAEWLTYVGRPLEALRHLDETLRRDPFPPNWYWEIRGMALFCLERYEEAISAYSKMTVLHPWIQAYLIAAYVHAGRRDDADRQLILYRGEHPRGSLLGIARQEPYKDGTLRDALIAGLQAVLPAAEDVDRKAIRDRPAAVASVVTAPAAAELPTDPGMGKLSIAVLPFVNLSGDPEQQYFSDGITDDIITELSRFRTLFVIARNSSFQYRGGALDIVRIGRELGVRYLCEGSVRRLGERVRVGAQLIEATSGTHLWGENFDRDAADILTVQDDIVRAIATTLGYRLEAAGRERTLRLSPQALSAYDLTLRSEALLLRHSKDDNAEAKRLAKQAVELDPRNALAHAQLGWTYCLDRIFGWVAESGETLETALALAQRAVMLDEADCRARWLLGHVHTFRREYDEARAQLCTAIALNPNDVEARGVYGLFLNAAGESDAALEQFDIAARHNPFEFNWIILCRGSALFTARRYDEALATLKRVHNPNNEGRLWLAASYAGAGCLPEARATLAEFLAVAEREMAQFPGRKLADWRPQLHRFVEYRDLREFDHLCATLQAAGLR